MTPTDSRSRTPSAGNWVAPESAIGCQRLDKALDSGCVFDLESLWEKI